jgi:hypothetical protein
MNYFLLYLVFITLLFLLYVEYSVGGILFRVNSSGKQAFHLTGALSYLINPLSNSFLWNLKLLDVNYIFIIGLSTILYHNKKLIFNL